MAGAEGDDGVRERGEREREGRLIIIMMRFRGPHNLPRWTHPTVPSHRNAGPTLLYFGAFPPPSCKQVSTRFHSQPSISSLFWEGPLRAQWAPVHRSVQSGHDLPAMTSWDIGILYSLSPHICRRGRLTCRHVSCWTTRVGTGDRTIPDFDFAI